MNGEWLIAALDHIEKIPERLLDAAADGRAFDSALLDASHSEPKAINCPLDVAEGLPEPRMARVDWIATRLFISTIQIFTRAEATDRRCPAEAPGPDAEPAQILHRVTRLCQFPVQYATDALFVGDEISSTEIAMHHRMPLLSRDILLSPSESELQRRPPKPIVVDDPAMSRNMHCRILAHQKRHAGRLDPMNRSKNLTALTGHYFAGRGKAFITDYSWSECLPCHPLSDIALAQLIVRFDYGQYLWRWRSCPLRGDHQPRLIGGSYLWRHTRDRVRDLSTQLDNQFEEMSTDISIERDGGAICAAGQPLEIEDRAGFTDMADHRSLEPFRQIVAVHCTGSGETDK